MKKSFEKEEALSAHGHLHRARLFRDKAELERARVLIEHHGYDRRLPELQDAQAALAHD